ncbi:MAG: hypothetical protein IT442_04935 [Phycisphaeraceae bacterium]|nr:hypothetical protein [Phycisphaeraceae bacterium]
MPGLRGQSRIPQTRDPRLRRNSQNLASTLPFINPGSAIGVDGDGKFTLNIATDEPFTQTTGLALTLGATPGLSKTSGSLKVLLDATEPGLQLTSGLKVLLATDPGLEFSTGLRAKVVAGGGIARGSGGLSFNILTTTGDLLGWSSALGRLGVGANQTVLTADSGQTFGFKWGTNALDASGNLVAATAGTGLLVKEGSDATLGLATLALGTVTVNTTKVTANSRVFLTAQDAGTAQGALYVSARTAGTSLTITSTNALDDRTVAWLIVEPAA